MSQLLKQKGNDVIHTDDLKNKERTTDEEIRNISRKEKRIVVSKDLDFLNSFYLNGEPEKLLIVTTGNIKNKKLFQLFIDNIDMIEELFSEHNLVELSNYEIIGHE